MKTIEDFISAINDRRFIEAHEILEHSWIALKRSGNLDEARTQKGLINAATALGLILQKNRPEAGKKLWERYAQKYPPLIDACVSEDGELYRRAAEMLEDAWGRLG